MSFFSDALADCAFAGVALGMLGALAVGAVKDGAYDQWGIPLTMVVFGVLVGLAIAYVKENTALANDTVIGVFFAARSVSAAMLFKALNVRSRFNPENFLFGDPTFVSNADLLILILLSLCTMAVLPWIYNRLVFTSFNASLARSRQIPMRLFNYAFIVLLALIVNLTLKTVGACSSMPYSSFQPLLPATSAATCARCSGSAFFSACSWG